MKRINNFIARKEHNLKMIKANKKIFKDMDFYNIIVSDFDISIYINFDGANIEKLKKQGFEYSNDNVLTLKNGNATIYINSQ